MRSMESYSRAAMERAMKVQEVILQAMAKKITWFQAAEIIGISDRHMRRWRERYEEGGFRGLFDRRQGKPSRERVRGGVWAPGWGALQTAPPGAVDGGAVAHRRQPTPMVSGRTLVRLDRDFGRRQQRDLLRATGGGGIDGDGDGGIARRDGAERCL